MHCLLQEPMHGFLIIMKIMDFRFSYHNIKMSNYAEFIFFMSNHKKELHCQLSHLVNKSMMATHAEESRNTCVR